jgi:hypothetical protein
MRRQRQERQGLATGLCAGLAAAVAVALALGAAEARACSFPDCGSLVTLPAPADLPANAVRFAVGQGALALGDAHGLELRRDDGAGVAASIKRPAGQPAYFSADEPLEPQQFYRLSYDGRCHRHVDGVAQGPPIPLSYRFRVFDGWPAPTTVGRLVEIERGTFRSQGGESELGTFVRLALRPSNEQSAYLGLTTWATRVDGQPFWSYFDVSASPPVITLRCHHRQRGGGSDSCGYASAVSPGQHKVELIPQTLGLAAQLPPVTADVSIDCEPAPPPIPPPATDASLDGALADAAVPGAPDAASDAGLPDAGVTATGEGAGCAVGNGSSGSSPSGAGGLLVMGLAAALGAALRVRRRRG